MLFTKEELDILNDMNCYENILRLIKSEMDGEEETYINNSDYWDTPLSEWFVDYQNERIYTMTLNDNTELFFFDNSDQNLDYDRYELLNKLFDNYEIKTSEDFDEVIVELQDELNEVKLTEEEIELLKKVYSYNYLDSLAEEWHSEEDLEEYISHFENLKYKFEDWFFDNEQKCEKIREIYLYIDLNDMFIPKKKLNITNQIKEIFDRYDIYSDDVFDKFKNKYVLK